MTEQTTVGEPEVKRGPGRPPMSKPELVPPTPAKPTMIPVKLLKHYRPKSMDFEIVEAAPSPLPGVGFTSRDKDKNVIGEKIWAGSTVSLPRDEAVALLNNEATSKEPRVGPDGKALRNMNGDILHQEVRRKFPLAERADPLPL